MSELNKDTNPLDDALKNALRREDAPDGFAERVLARAAQQESVPRKKEWAPWPGMWSQPLLRWGAFAAVTAALVVGAVHYRHVERERAQGEEAKQQLMLALRIAGSKLQLAKAKVNEINQPATDGQPSLKRPSITQSRSRS